MNPKSTWWMRLSGKRGAVPAHARTTALAFAGPQTTPLDELLDDAAARSECRYAPSMVAWMRQQYQVAVYEAEDYRTQAQHARYGEKQSLVRAANIRQWLAREADIEIDDPAEQLRNGEYYGEKPTAAEQTEPAQQRPDLTAAYAQQAPAATPATGPASGGQPRTYGEDAAFYGRHYGGAAEAEPQAEMTPTREFAPIGGDR